MAVMITVTVTIQNLDRRLYPEVERALRGFSGDAEIECSDLAPGETSFVFESEMFGDETADELSSVIERSVKSLLAAGGVVTVDVV